MNKLTLWVWSDVNVTNCQNWSYNVTSAICRHQREDHNLWIFRHFFFFWSVEDFLKLIYAGLREKLNGDLRDQKINSQVCIQICPYCTLFLSTKPQTFCRQYRWVRDLLSSGSNPYRFQKNWMYEPDVARIRALGLVNTKQSLSYFATEIIF